MSRDETYMMLAMMEAEKAAAAGDVPVGALIVKDGEIVARGYNTREQCGDVLGHAELNAIREATRKLGDWRLTGCTLYVTLEPCPMCTGACIQARLDRIVFGAFDKKAGCCGSVLDLTALHLESEPDIFAGVLDDVCAAQLDSFFKSRRNEENQDG